MSVSAEGGGSWVGCGEEKSGNSAGKSDPTTYVSQDEYDKQKAARKKQVDAVIARNRARFAAINACGAQSDAGNLTGTGLDRCIARNQAEDLPPGLDLAVAGDPADAVVIPPRQIAYQAIVRLRLTPPKPGIGPSPDLNRWKMAAVGYPLWLWGDGNLDPAPVSQSVANLSVALDAKVDKIVFRMGDGQTVTCTGSQLNHPWRRGAVEPGTPSPYCGYRYAKPSLPAKKYTVTAVTTWRVDWELNGQTGTETLVQRSTVTLPVGELQVVVR